MSKIAENIKKLRKSLGLKQEELAERLGESDQSIVSKWEREKQKPNSERTAKLAALARVSVDEFLGLEPAGGGHPLRTYYVVGELQAGAWRESLEWLHEDQFPITLPAPESARNMVGIQSFVVKGNSMNKVYKENTYVFVAPTIANGIRPKNGDIVLVTRRDKSGLYEATLKEYVVEGRSRQLIPRSTDPKHQEPIPYKGKNTEEATITGIVVGHAYFGI